MKIGGVRWNSFVGAWMVLCLLVLGWSVPKARATSAPRPQWIKQVGNYRLVKWGKPGLNETLLIRDVKNREVACVKDHSINFVYGGDLTGDGFPEVILQTYYTGAHSSVFYYVYSLGPSPRCLLKYDKNNFDEAGLIPDFWPKDLDGDGIKEIVSWYDGFAYGGLDAYECRASYADSARVPVVFGFRSGRYQEVSAKYRPYLNRLLTRVEATMREKQKEVGTHMKWGDDFQTVLQCYVVLYQLDGPVLAKRRLRSIAPRSARETFERHARQFDDILAARKSRYSYPRVYARKAEAPRWQAEG